MKKLLGVVSLSFLFIISGSAQRVELTRTAQTCVYKADFINVFEVSFVGENTLAAQRENTKSVELYDCATGALLGCYQPYMENGLFGKSHIECPVYFEEGRSMAKFENGNVCIIDRNANIIKTIQGAVSAYPFHQGLSLVLFKAPEDDFYTIKFYDREGNELNHTDYHPFNSFSKTLFPTNLCNGRRRNYENEKYGYLDADGNLMIGYKFQQAEDFSEGLASVSTNGDYFGVIDTDGNYVIEEKLRHAPGYFSNGYAKIEKTNHNFAIIDKEGNIYQNLEFSRLSQGHFGYFIGDLLNSKLYHVIVDTNTDKIIDLKGTFIETYDGIGDYYSEDEFLKRRKLYSWGKGKVEGFPEVIKASSDLKYFFVDSPAGVIDRLGRYIIVFEESEL